jgi:hypothetical protein
MFDDPVTGAVTRGATLAAVIFLSHVKEGVGYLYRNVADQREKGVLR